MSTPIERRLDALEARQSVSDPIFIVRFITLPGDKESEPARAEVAGKPMLRCDGETGEAFLARVKAEARLAAKPGCVGVALVWPSITPMPAEQRDRF